MSTPPDRRAFLRIGGLSVLAAGAGSAGATARPAAASTPASAGTGANGPAARASVPHAAGAAGASGARSAPGPGDWRALGAGLEGRLVRPGDAAYDRARRLFNPAYDSVRPAAVAYCANPSDVAECVTFARRTGLPLAVRSGGHSYAGWSTGTGLVVDVSPMSSVRHSSGRAIVGAGAKLVDVYDRLAADGVSIPAGTCATVGVSGLALGGGIGVVSRKYGLTCDVMESVQIVTADGRLLTCDADHDADLYWACRGGGGGNFGVAVSFGFRTHPVREVTVFFLHWPWSKAARVLRAWQAWGPSAPDALWSGMHLTHENGTDVQVVGLHLGGRADCERLLDRLTAAAGSPSRSTVDQTSYRHAMMLMAGCGSLSVAQCHLGGSLPGQTRAGRLSRDTFAATSHLAYRPLSETGIRTLVAEVSRAGDHTVLLDALGGAVGRVRPDATAFPHRAALYSVQYYAHRAGAARWARNARAAMRPHFGDHAYVNYIDAGLSGWRSAYYGPNAARLARVKAAYDPGRLFRMPQAV
ncbi:FAD/FMN-containing dehydrogenase [Streptosporangium becharense]|uniref:FAD/FMN-containing dehydrogenase n=1 Tax=Streptosporangium becharense TaxID=1816182 RepID=A0A7W9IEJ0_9ACTN|nr:FAD-binding oxidoreductase [Streptosporangium becharense]MBB2909755.1 FAD/FMN-containing dehydrogenase [Streptosporangium becharense]MBB5819289.1 FAD/FMN-containing dehydrogenase [Streptosporangium becharense]